MPAQVGFARAKVLPRRAEDSAGSLAASSHHPVQETGEVLVGEQSAVDLRVLCIAVSTKTVARMQALLQAITKVDGEGGTSEGDRAAMMRAQRQLRSMGHTVSLEDASATTMRELKERLCSEAGHRPSAAVQLMALQRALESRVTAAAAEEEVATQLKAATAATARESVFAELVVLPDGMLVSMLREQSADPRSPLQLFRLPALSDSGDKADLVVFYTHSESRLGVVTETLCACACCAACCACLACCCCCCCANDGN